MSQPEVKVSSDRAGLVERAATSLLDRIARVQQRGPDPGVAVCLTGGSIAAALHESLGAHPDRDRVDWSRTSFWWGDERYVPRDSPDRNAAQARRAWLGPCGVPDEQIHEMPAADGQFGSVDDAAESYAQELRAHLRGPFDVLMLGVGPDGHVASLFPGFPQLDVKDSLAVAVTDSPKPPPVRISLTFAALNRAREVWFLVSGSDKARAVAAALAEGTDVHVTPAAGVKGQQQTTWFLDSEATIPTD